MPNFLEQIAAEWFEVRGYFVRRNVKVGPRKTGGWDAELDVVAFDPITKHLVHVEPSSDALPWDRREERFRKKFDAGRKHIPGLFKGFGKLPEIEQIALFVFGSGKRHPTVGGGQVLMIADLMADIRQYMKNRSIQSKAIPEQFVILRTLQYAAQLWR